MNSNKLTRAAYEALDWQSKTMISVVGGCLAVFVAFGLLGGASSSVWARIVCFSLAQASIFVAVLFGMSRGAMLLPTLGRSWRMLICAIIVLFGFLIGFADSAIVALHGVALFWVINASLLVTVFMIGYSPRILAALRLYRAQQEDEQAAPWKLVYLISLGTVYLLIALPALATLKVAVKPYSAGLVVGIEFLGDCLMGFALITIFCRGLGWWKAKRLRIFSITAIAINALGHVAGHLVEPRWLRIAMTDLAFIPMLLAMLAFWGIGNSMDNSVETVN